VKANDILIKFKKEPTLYCIDYINEQKDEDTLRDLLGLIWRAENFWGIDKQRQCLLTCQERIKELRAFKKKIYERPG